VNSAHHVRVAIGVDDNFNTDLFSSDFDMRSVELHITYYVLQ
jgi:hypothetical protein